jgi:hypothetical protein
LRIIIYFNYDISQNISLFMNKDLLVTFGNEFKQDTDYIFENGGEIKVINNSISFTVTFNKQFTKNSMNLTIDSQNSSLKTSNNIKLT